MLYRDGDVVSIRRINFCRDGKFRQSLTHRMDEVEQQLKLESQQRVENDKDSRMAAEETEAKMKAASEENAESVRKLLTVRVTR